MEKTKKLNLDSMHDLFDSNKKPSIIIINNCLHQRNIKNIKHYALGDKLKALNEMPFPWEVFIQKKKKKRK